MARKKPVADQLLEDVAAGKKKPGRHQVARNLYVAIKERRRGGYTANWLHRFQHNRKSHWFTIGPCDLISSVQAQIEVHDARVNLLRDMIWTPVASLRRKESLRSQMPTFTKCANEYIAAHESSWRNAAQSRLWTASLQRYVYPRIGDTLVSDITTEDILAIVKPHWERIPKSAKDLLGRIEAVLDSAIAQDLRSAANPARWKNHLDMLLPAPRKLRVKHHTLPYAEIPAFMAELRVRDDEVSRAMAFLVLTAARNGEVRGVDWREIDTERHVWCVPASRMKANAEHRVPLTAEALALLGATSAGLVFPGVARDAMQDRLQRLRTGFHTHGFRAAFSTWASEQTDFADEVIEACLAHLVGPQTRRAYKRGDPLFEKRRQLMQRWSDYCLTPPAANVVPLQKQAAG
jgi:integrase